MATSQRLLQDGSVSEMQEVAKAVKVQSFFVLQGSQSLKSLFERSFREFHEQTLFGFTESASESLLAVRQDLKVFYRGDLRDVQSVRQFIVDNKQGVVELLQKRNYGNLLAYKPIFMLAAYPERHLDAIQQYQQLLASNIEDPLFQQFYFVVSDWARDSKFLAKFGIAEDQLPLSLLVDLRDKTDQNHKVFEFGFDAA